MSENFKLSRFFAIVVKSVRKLTHAKKCQKMDVKMSESSHDVSLSKCLSEFSYIFTGFVQFLTFFHKIIFWAFYPFLESSNNFPRF